MQLDISEISKCLGVPESTVHRWIRQGRLPVRRVGEEFSFSQAALERWARQRNLSFFPPSGDTTPQQTPQLENLQTVMRRGGIVYDLEAADVPSALRAASDSIPDMEAAEREDLYQRLLAREQLASTGIGKGVAIPHPRNPAGNDTARSLITTCFMKKPVDFKAVDHLPVFVMFVLLSPSVKAHLHLLSRLTYCVRDDAFVAFLKTKPAPTDFFEHIARLEKQLVSAGY
jgi:PTS system nitrogen regulatory IIA component